MNANYKCSTEVDLPNLLAAWHLIDERNRQLGWMRYDPGDLDNHSLFSGIHYRNVRRIARNAIRVADLLAPIAIHSALNVQRTIVPTAFYHVGMAYLLREQLSVRGQDWQKDEASTVCSQVLALRLEAEHNCWAHPYPHHASRWREGHSCPEPPSCAHHTARLGILHLEVGIAHRTPQLISAGTSAARALNEYHRWKEYADGTATVSYYPNTDDETINTCADVAALLALVPPDQDFPGRQERALGIVRMILKEQKTDGSWMYCTARHYLTHNDTPCLDNHHSAQVIQALARIHASGVLPAALRSQVSTSIRHGIEYYSRAFIKADGSSSYFPNGKRPADIVAYTEGIAAIAWCFRGGVIAPEECLGKRILSDATQLLTSSLRFLDRRTFDVASAERFHTFYRIKSLRWGSGPLLEAIQHYLWIASGPKTSELSDAAVVAR